MDGELITVLGGGIIFIAAAVGFLLFQRRKNAAGEAAAGAPAAPAKAAKKRQKPNAPEKKPEKKSLLASLSSIGVGDKNAEPKQGKGAAHKATKAELAELDSLIEAGHNDDAARLAMRLMQWDKAAQLYLKLEQPGNAAHCAKRAGKLEMAAELYEKANDAENAAIMWEKSGNSQRARQVAGKSKPGRKGDDDTIIQISKELQKEIDAAIEKRDHMRAAELYEQAGDKENAAEQFATFAQTARRPEMYAEKIQALSPRVAYNLLRIATKGRPPGQDSIELYRRLAMLQHHFGNRKAAIATLEKLIAAAPDDEEARQMLEEIGEDPSPHPDLDDDDELVSEPGVSAEPAEVDDRLEVELEADEPPSQPASAKPASSARKVAAPRLPAGARKNGGAAAPDEAVEAAKSGPSIADLVAMIGDKPCDLGNIEVYYRLGLACLAARKVDDARRAFEAVDETSPGYRDTEKRLQTL